MKRILFTSIFLLLAVLCFGQGVIKSDASADNMIDRYFSSYRDRIKFKSTLGEKMIKRSIEMGMFKNQDLVRIMNRVKTYKSLIINYTPSESQKIISGIAAEIKKDHSYEEYYRYDNNKENSYIIYTRGGQVIRELVVIEINNHLNITCFLGDHIDMNAIRELTIGRK